MDLRMFFSIQRGWTAYLTAAVDPRVIALSPTVLSCLNFGPVSVKKFENTCCNEYYLVLGTRKSIFQRMLL